MMRKHLPIATCEIEKETSVTVEGAAIDDMNCCSVSQQWLCIQERPKQQIPLESSMLL